MNEDGKANFSVYYAKSFYNAFNDIVGLVYSPEICVESHIREAYSGEV